MAPDRHLFRNLAVGLALLIGGALGIGLVLDHLFPFPPDKQDNAIVVLDRNGVPLRTFADKDGIWRFPATPGDVSPRYLEALLNYEDRWFYHHPGINPLAMVRAAFQNIAQGRTVSGGSTLTMQVARILDKGARRYPPLLRKCRQMLRALQLERHLDKNEILSLYLTHAPFGANIEGVRAAAYTWLGKDTDALTHAEAALLAVLPQAPSRYRPDRHPERAARARDKVLDRMKKNGVWPEKIVSAARQEPVLPFRFPAPMQAPLAARRLAAAFPDTPLIRTLIDNELQVHVADILKSHVAGLAPKQSGAVLVVEHREMNIRAYAGFC